MRAARALFNAVCAACHGRDGTGGGPNLPPGAAVASFADPAWQSARSDAEIAKVIRDGRNMMPAFGDQLRDEGVQVLVAYLRTLAVAAQPDGAPDAPSAPQPPSEPPTADERGAAEAEPAD